MMDGIDSPRFRTAECAVLRMSLLRVSQTRMKTKDLLSCMVATYQEQRVSLGVHMGMDFTVTYSDYDIEAREFS